MVEQSGKNAAKAAEAASAAAAAANAAGKIAEADRKAKEARAYAHKAAAAAAAAAAASAAVEYEERENAIKTQEGRKDRFFKINMTLPVSLDKILEDMGTEARSSGGFKVPKTTIIRSLIRLSRILQVDMTGVKTEHDMLDRLLEAAKRYKGN